MRSLLTPKYLHWIEWGALIGAIILLVVKEDYHPWMILSIGLLGVNWVARWLRSGRLTRSTPIDVLILLFIISALIALWAAPNRLAGLVRFYLILTAVTFFYTLVNSDQKSLGMFSSVFIIFTGFAGIFLMSQYDWGGSQARFQLIEEVGRWLNRLAPNLRLSLPYWNATRNLLASILAISLPVAVLGLFSARKKDNRSKLISGSSWRSWPFTYWVAGLSLVLIIFGLILTESRTPWMVYGVIIILWIWWWLIGRITSKLPYSQTYIFLISLGIVCTLVCVLVILQPQLLSYMIMIPGPKDYLSRGEIYPQAWRLAQDTPYTGGGLAAFPALYSTYIRVIPFNVFLNEDTGNNAYLNLLVEQGWLGALSYTVLLLVAFGVAIWRFGGVDNESKSFVMAGILGIGFILLHGIVHATLVATRALPFLLIPAGLALSGVEIGHITRNSEPGEHSSEPKSLQPSRRSWQVAAVVAILIVFSALLILFRTPLLSAWYANLGVIRMSQSELSDFPSGKWDDGSRVTDLYPVVKLFERALQYNPNNRTAQHRLGLIAMLERDFRTAVDNLEKAHQLDPNHLGIRKNLGYSYAWTGQPESAARVLADIPEARDEMVVYVGWWENQSRPDLAQHAESAIAHLGEK